LSHLLLRPRLHTWAASGLFFAGVRNIYKYCQFINSYRQPNPTHTGNVQQALLRYSPRHRPVHPGRIGCNVCASGSVCCLPGETGCCAPPSTTLHIFSDLGVCLPPC
ncbi:hypothetical protein FB45DRAFT_1063505, partial [Roridomyces roridus]